MPYPYKLVIFDLNGTLVQSKSGATFPHGINDMELIPGRREKVWEVRRSGALTAIATNQGGAAFGLLDPNEFGNYLRRLNADLWLNDHRVCFHHPDPKGKARMRQWVEDCACRKPKPGMLLSLMRQFGVEPLDTLMVGDLQEDRDAATNAGCHFQWADQFFGEMPPVDYPPAEGGAV